VGLYLNMLTNFSILPLRFASYAGLVSSVVGLALAGNFIIERIYDPSIPVGWASMIVSLFIIGGIQLFSLGMIGEYLGRLFLKDKGRPQFVVRETFNCEPSTGSGARRPHRRFDAARRHPARRDAALDDAALFDAAISESFDHLTTRSRS